MAIDSTPQSSPSSSKGSLSPPTPENPCHPYPVAMFYNPWNAYQIDPYYASSPASMAMYGMPMHYPMLPNMMPPSISSGVSLQPKTASPTKGSKTTLANTELSPIKDESNYNSKSPHERSKSNPENKTESRGNRTNYSRKQVEVLERMFCLKAYPDTADFERLEKELDISMKCIKVWFQNKRARSRKRVGGQTTFTTMIPHAPSMRNIPVTTLDVSPPASIPSSTTQSQADLSTKPSSSPPTTLHCKSEPGTFNPHRKSLSPNGSQSSTKSPAMPRTASVQSPMMSPMPYYPGYMPYPMYSYPYMYSQCR